MKKVCFLGILLIFLGSFMYAGANDSLVLSFHNPYRLDNNIASHAQDEQAKMVYPDEPIPRHLGTAVAEIVGVNIFVWAIGQYALDAEAGGHSYINLDTMQSNLKNWFYWDPNNFNTNFIAHPYHGNLYFNAARTNGMDFWSSAFGSLAGSFMWEFFMERHQPSINDWVMTTTGGMFLGEVLFRYSSLIWDDSATGFNRVWREIVGTLVNPLGGLNRLARGDMTKVRSSKNQITAPTLTRLYWSGNLSSGNENMSDSSFGSGFEILTRYGLTFTGGEKRDPFDLFLLQAAFRKTEAMNMTVYAYGLLVGKELKSGENQNHMIGLFQHFDYIQNETIELGGTSFCPGLFSEFTWGENSRLSFLAHAGWMMLGASNNEYIGSGEGSAAEGISYNYGTGITIKLDVGLDLNRFGSYIARLRPLQHIRGGGSRRDRPIESISVPVESPGLEVIRCGACLHGLPPQLPLCGVSGCQAAFVFTQCQHLGQILRRDQ